MELTESRLRKLYATHRLSTWRIEELTGWPRSVVYNKLKKFGMKPRGASESHIRYRRKHFDGSTLEKAYLIGFSIGDLRVRKAGKSECQTIGLACSSTKPAQIRLIKDLFSPYGRVWVSRPSSGDKISVEAFVDLSFGFLLPAEREKIDWIFNNDRHFLPFLAGFTDAEGSIFISRKQAFLSWGNYNHSLLSRIRDALEKLGIQTGEVVCDHLRGYKGKEGYRRKADYYQLRCGRKKPLQSLLKMLQPFLRHRDREMALRRALKNIAVRNAEFGFVNM
ncbi:MAG: LAGLIDADG family homing endonuclease [Candidatus Jorgensenbacteria bacterium]